MKSKEFAIIAIFSLLIIIIVIQLTSQQPLERGFFDRNFPIEPPQWLELFPYLLLTKTVLSSVNSILLTILLATYIGVYNKTRSEFTIGLIIFTLALMLYSLTSNPLIHGILGFRVSGLGPFTILPDLFTCIASAILLYLSQK